jgi:hypothetical protein
MIMSDFLFFRISTMGDNMTLADAVLLRSFLRTFCFFLVALARSAKNCFNKSLVDVFFCNMDSFA